MEMLKSESLRRAPGRITRVRVYGKVFLEQNPAAIRSSLCDEELVAEPIPAASLLNIIPARA